MKGEDINYLKRYLSAATGMPMNLFLRLKKCFIKMGALKIERTLL